MAVRIPQYDQRTTPSSLGVQPRASGQHFDQGVARGLGALSGALDQAAATVDHVRDRAEAERKAQEAEDAKVWSASQIAGAQQWGVTKIVEMQEQAGDGAPEFTKAFGDAFDEYQSQALENAPNEASRKFLGERLLALRADLTGKALGFELGERQKWRVGQMDQGRTAAAATVAVDPSRFNVVRAEQAAAIDALLAPPEVKRALRAELDDSMSKAAVLGEIERDPDMARRKLLDRLGVHAADAEDRKAPRTLPQDVQGKYEAMSSAFGFETTSTTRSAAENAKVGGVANSQHLHGAARDWSIKGKTPEQIAGFVQALQAEGFEAGVHTKGTAPHIHAELPPGRATGPTIAQAAAAKPEGEATGDPVYDLLPVPAVVQLLNAANSSLDKQQSQARSLIAAREADDLAAFGDGKQVPQPISAGEFVTAYGGVEGARRYAAYQDAQRYAADISTLSTMAPEDIQARVAARAPKPGPGYAVEAKLHAGYVQAAAAVLTQRAQDPIAFAGASGIAQVEPLDMADGPRFREELRRRVGVAATMRDVYRTDYTLLTRAEGEQMVQAMGRMTAPERGQFLANVRQALPDAAPYHAIMAQLRPDSPVTATAGSLLALPSNARVATAKGGMFSDAPTMTAAQVAKKLLIGEDLLNPSKDAKGNDGKPKFPMPADTDLRATWVDYTGTAYADAPETEQANYQAYRAFYAAEAARLGQYDGEFNDDIAEAAARAVTGGVIELGNSRILLPYGADEGATLDALDREWARAREAAGLPESIDLSRVSLQTVADGVYAVNAGTGPLRDKAGRPVRLRVTRPDAAGGAR